MQHFIHRRRAAPPLLSGSTDGIAAFAVFSRLHKRLLGNLPTEKLHYFFVQKANWMLILSIPSTHCILFLVNDRAH